MRFGFRVRGTEVVHTRVWTLFTAVDGVPWINRAQSGHTSTKSTSHLSLHLPLRSNVLLNHFFSRLTLGWLFTEDPIVENFVFINQLSQFYFKVFSSCVHKVVVNNK